MDFRPWAPFRIFVLFVWFSSGFPPVFLLLLISFHPFPTVFLLAPIRALQQKSSVVFVRFSYGQEQNTLETGAKAEENDGEG